MLHVLVYDVLVKDVEVELVLLLEVEVEGDALNVVDA